MNLHELVSQLIIDTKGLESGGVLTRPWADSSVGAFLPELCLCATIVLMLLVRVLPGGRRVNVAYFALVGSGLAFGLTGAWGLFQEGGFSPGDPRSVTRMEIFTGMLVYDPFTVFMRSVLLGFAFLFTLLTQLTGIPDKEDGPDFYTLVLGATLGMCMMAAANHLMMVFLAVEMASVPSYVLAGLLKGRRLSSEAALKYSIYGGGTAGVMLYGISLLAGLLNTAHLPTLAERLAERLPHMPADELAVLALAGLMILVGLAFKLSAVPFHFWCPDVFEGATAEVNAFLSVASKAAALGLLVRVAFGVGVIPPQGVKTGERSISQQVAETPLQPRAANGGNRGQETRLAMYREVSLAAPGAGQLVSAAGKERSAAAKLRSLGPARDYIGKLIAFLAAITCTFGNLAAYAQTNIKRLLAYSTIAHAGYMMMSVSAAMVLAGYGAGGAESAIAALAIYIAVYLFMNLGAFAVVAFLRNAMFSEEIADYAGLIRRCPGVVICFAVILFSLVGLPPLSGFVGKFAVFASLVAGYDASATAGEPQAFLLVLLVVGGLNTFLSLFYYVRVIKIMTFDEEPEQRRMVSLPILSPQGLYLCLLTAPTVLLILRWDILSRWALAAAQFLVA